MIRHLVLLVLAVAAPDAMAQTLGERLQQGIGRAAEGVERGVSQGADLLERGAERLGETVDSTVDLATNEETPEATRAKLDAMEIAVLSRLLREVPEADPLFARAAGHAVFDTRRTVLVGLAAGFGRGVAVDRVRGTRTYMNMGTGGVGLSLGLGGFETQVVILFENQRDFDAFVTQGLDATAEGGAMFGADSVGETLRFIDGRKVFVLGGTGVKVSGTLTGTRYWPAPGLN